MTNSFKLFSVLICDGELSLCKSAPKRTIITITFIAIA